MTSLKPIKRSPYVLLNSDATNCSTAFVSIFSLALSFVQLPSEIYTSRGFPNPDFRSNTSDRPLLSTLPFHLFGFWVNRRGTIGNVRGPLTRLDSHVYVGLKAIMEPSPLLVFWALMGPQS